MTGGRIVERFDPGLRMADSVLKQTTADFLVYLEAQEAKLAKRRRQRKMDGRAKFRVAVEALLANLTTAFARSPKALLNVPLSNSVLRGNPRYRPPVYGKHFRDLISLLEDLRLITIVTKGHNVREWGRKEITTIRPTAKLLNMFLLAAPAGDKAFTRVEPPEVIILKDREGLLTDYRDNEETRRWREEVRTINAALTAAPISTVSGRNLIDDRGFMVQPNVRTLRRIWNNSTWTEGGRLYDGFWQTMKREERLPSIRIDDQQIANVDFSQFNLRLAYALAKVGPPPGDLYDVTGRDASRADWKRLREGRKKLVNAMINRRAPLAAWPGETAEERRDLAGCFPKGTTARTATNEIRSKHSAISDYFENGRGLSFMRIESDILVATLLSLIKQGITALPLHDAVLVQERHAAVAKAALEQESKRRIGTDIPAEITILGGEAG